MTATAIAGGTSTVECEVARIRTLVKERRFAEGVAAATALCGRFPENRDVLYLLALGQRQLTRSADALATLEHLERLHPRFSRLHQERGHCHVALKDAPQAIEALLQAVNINPALPASWRMLEGLYRMTGDADNAAPRRRPCRHAEDTAAGSGDGDRAVRATAISRRPRR